MLDGKLQTSNYKFSCCRDRIYVTTNNLTTNALSPDNRDFIVSKSTGQIGEQVKSRI